MIAPSILLTLTVPNINQYLPYLYKSPDVIKYNAQGYIFIGIFLLSLVVLMLVTVMSRAYQEVKEEVLIQDLILRKNLISILQDVLLKLEEK
ncbi:hypothetical protein D3C80_2038870 [compost metagenome]